MWLTIRRHPRRAPGSPAAKAGIGPRGALLLAVNGQKLDGTLTDYCSKVADVEPGQPVTLLDKPGARPRTVTLPFSG